MPSSLNKLFFQVLFFKKQIMGDLRTAIPLSSAMRVQGVTLPSWSRLVTTMLRVEWLFNSTYYTYLSSGFKVRPMALLWRRFYGVVPLMVTFISISYRETWKVRVVILAPKVT